MGAGLIALTLLCGSIFAGALGASAQDAPPPGAITLSQDLLDMLKAEMRAITGGVQRIPLALASGDWTTIETTSRAIHDSYIMEKKLTPPQAEQLERALPARFKQLDVAFHQRAAQLGSAAVTHDPQKVALQYSRLLESCTTCHAQFAGARFPGLALRAGRSAP